MMRKHRVLLIISVLASGFALSACESFDPENMFNQKKPLPGDRRSVFPEGVPGVPQGVPRDLVQGYQAPVEPPPPEPAAVVEKPKPRPKRVAQPAPRPQRAAQPPQQQQADPQAAPWPAQPAQQQTTQSPFPEPPASGTFRR